MDVKVTDTDDSAAFQQYVTKTLSGPLKKNNPFFNLNGVISPKVRPNVLL